MQWTEAIRKIFLKHDFEEDGCTEMWRLINHIENGGDIDDFFLDEDIEEIGRE